MQLTTSHSTLQHLHAQAMLLLPTFKSKNVYTTTTTNQIVKNFSVNSQHKNYLNPQYQRNDQFNQLFDFNYPY